jgi:hypothetical protein
VIALRLQIEERVERDDAENLRYRQVGLGGDEAQFIGAKEFAGIMLLDGFQDAQQGARFAAVKRHGFLNECEIPRLIGHIPF